MNCDFYRGRLDAALDGALPTEEMAALDAHLRGCSSCATEALARTQWKRTVASAGNRYVPSAAFRRQVLEQIQPRRKAAWSWRWFPQSALAALVVIVIAGLLYRSSTSEQPDPFGELADAHVAIMASSNPVDVVSSDRHTVKPWFQGKLPFSFDLPELANSPYTLIGGRLAYFQQSPAAHLLFQYQQHRISVFIFQEKPGLPGVEAGKVQSFTVDNWVGGGLRFVMIGDAEPEVLNRLAQLLKAAQTR